jgi:translation initiation factor IF-1
MNGKQDVEGTVEETLPKSLFRVRLDDGTEVRAALSSQAKRVTVKLLPGDRVRVNLSAYDPSRGRILTKL